MFKVKITGKPQIGNECLSRRELLNCWTLFHQTWYGDASSWARVLCKKGWFAVLKVKVRVKTHIIKIRLSATSSELLNLLQPSFGLMAHHHELGCLVKSSLCCFVLKVKVTAEVQNLIEFSSGSYCFNCWMFCIQILCDDASSWARVRVTCKQIGLLSSRSQSQWGLIIKHDCFSHINWTSQPFLQSDLIRWYFVIFWSVLCQHWIVLFKVRVKVLIFIASLLVFCFLYHWSLGNQTRCVDVLLIINKTKHIKVGIYTNTDSNTVTYSITLHTIEGVFLPNEMTHLVFVHFGVVLVQFLTWIFTIELILVINVCMLVAHSCWCLGMLLITEHSCIFYCLTQLPCCRLELKTWTHLHLKKAVLLCRHNWYNFLKPSQNMFD